MTLLIDDFIYSVDIFAPIQDGSDAVSEPLDVAEIAKRFAAAVADVRQRLAAGEQAPRVGLLTADDRDSWTKVTGKESSTDVRTEKNSSFSPLKIGKP
jgi:hypothetical protein